MITMKEVKMNYLLFLIDRKRKLGWGLIIWKHFITFWLVIRGGRGLKILATKIEKGGRMILVKQ